MGSSVLHFGPAHPAAHGVLRCILLMQGEYILSTVLTLGLLHRGTEKLMEMRHTSGGVAYMDRLDYVSMLSNELCYAETLEALLEVEVSYAHHLVRVLLAELARIENHLLNIACHAGDLGCLLALLWLFEDRESMYDVLAISSGARMHASSIVPGGLRGSPSLSAMRELVAILHTMSMRMDLLVHSVVTHRIWALRLHGVGVLHESTGHLPCSGVLLRSTGVA